jgi:NDP-sugar pyrophosphorylase family protein
MKSFQKCCDAILLAGGLGTRFKAVTGPNLNKVLYPLQGRELIDYTIDTIPTEYVDNLIFATAFLKEQVHKWLLQRSLFLPLKISYQTQPGVLSAIIDASKISDKEHLLVANTDEVRLGIDVQEVINHHIKTHSIATLVATKSNHLSRHGVLILPPYLQDQEGSLISNFILKPEGYIDHPSAEGWIFTGMAVFDKKALLYASYDYNKDWMGLLTPLCNAGKLSAFLAPNIKYFNVGTENELHEAQKYLSLMDSSKSL